MKRAWMGLLVFSLIFCLLLAGCKSQETASNTDTDAPSSDSAFVPQEVGFAATSGYVYSIMLDYAQALYDNTTEVADYFPQVNGVFQVATSEPPLFTDWAILEEAMVYRNAGPLLGYAIDVYRMNIAFQTSTPDIVSEAEPRASVDEDGWFSLTMDEDLYLVCHPYGDEEDHLALLFFTWAGDVDDAFAAHLEDALMDIDPDGMVPRRYLQDMQREEGKLSYRDRTGTLLPVSDSNASMLETVFDCPWEPVAEYTLPTGETLFLGSDEETFFQFFAESDLVLLHLGNTVVAWRAGDGVDTLSEQVFYLHSQLKDST